MAKGKLARYNAIKEMDTVYEYPEGMEGKWNDAFGNQNPIILELACGRGEYSIGLAKLNNQENFLGVDIKGERIYVGARAAKREELDNVRFLRTQIEKIDLYFGEEEIDAIWLPFPDPQLRLSRMKKRLTHPNFLIKYQRFLKKRAGIHLKTDSPNLYNFTKAVINYFNLSLVEDYDNIDELDDVKEELKIKTFYQELDIAGKQRVHYLHFKLNQEIPVDYDQEQFTNYIKENLDNSLT